MSYLQLQYLGYDCFWKETMCASAGPISFPGSDSNLNLDYDGWRHDPMVTFLTLTRLPACRKLADFACFDCVCSSGSRPSSTGLWPTAPSRWDSEGMTGYFSSTGSAGQPGCFRHFDCATIVLTTNNRCSSRRGSRTCCAASLESSYTR